MSIFLRPGQIKVRDDTGEFTSINVMAETSANEIINNIEAAGQEIIESIPADYTELTEEVDELNERIDNTNANINAIAVINKPLDLIDYPYQRGYLDTGGVFVSTPSSSTQKTTEPIYLQPGNYNIDFVGTYNDSAIDYVRAIAVYNASNVCTQYLNTANLKSFTLQTTDKYIKINTTASTITKYEVYNTAYGDDTVVKINDDVIIGTDKSLTIANKPADAKVVGDRLNEIVVLTNKIILDKTYNEWLNGYLDESTGAFVSTNNHQHTTDFIELEHPGAYGFTCTFNYQGSTLTTPRMIGIYNSDYSFSRKVTTSADITEIILRASEKYIRINIPAYPSDIADMKLCYLKYEDSEHSINIADDVIIPYTVSNYIHARRPIIAFILDGEYDMNDDMEEVFSDHGVKAGFAIPYNTAFPNNKCSKYLEWQAKGHEILSHSATSVSSSIADSTVDEIVKNALLTLEGYGFDIHGFVAYQGNAGNHAIEESKKWFDYGCNVANHSGDSTGSLAESCMFYNTTAPYLMWRYSMQASTLQQMKDAVDRCISQTGLLVFYGHARSAVEDNFTTENLDALLTYIETVGGTVKKPYDAISDYYSIRYDDISHN